jgi:hypothetical protein
MTVTCAKNALCFSFALAVISTELRVTPAEADAALTSGIHAIPLKESTWLLHGQDTTHDPPVAWKGA